MYNSYEEYLERDIDIEREEEYPDRYEEYLLEEKEKENENKRKFKYDTIEKTIIEYQKNLTQSLFDGVKGGKI